MNASIVDYAFRPALLNVTTGTTVIWTYATNGTDLHTVTAKNQTEAGEPIFASMNPNPLHPGQSYDFTFNNPGKYAYFCAVHPTLMNALVNVTGPPVTSQTPSPDNVSQLVVVVGIGAAISTVTIGAILLHRRRTATRVRAGG